MVLKTIRAIAQDLIEVLKSSFRHYLKRFIYKLLYRNKKNLKFECLTETGASFLVQRKEQVLLLPSSFSHVNGFDRANHQIPIACHIMS